MNKILEAYRRFARQIKKHHSEDRHLDILDEQVGSALSSLEDDLIGIAVKAQEAYKEPV